MSPGRLDTAVIRRHLAALERAIVELRRHAGRPIEDLRASTAETWLVERGLQLCAQNALDIATHISAAAGLDAPDYTTAIDQLATLGVVDAPFAHAFRAVAGFRNVLVHGYLEVDSKILHDVLNTRLVEFERFAGAVRVYMTSPPP